MKESDLYPPLKKYLELQHYDVKGEIGNCDVFAVRNTEPPLVVELKLSLNLTLILQAVDRLVLTSNVYIAVPKKCNALKQKYKQVIKLCKLLGIGLITIDPSRSSEEVNVLLDPSEYKPRISKHRQTRLLGEFEKRVGDPNLGGSDTKKGTMTAYRQRAIKIAMLLDKQGPTKASDIANEISDTKARDILYKDVYGWFDKISRGIYALSPRGKKEVTIWIKPEDLNIKNQIS